MDKYIIIFGSNGYIGKYLVLEAIKRGYRVIGIKYKHFRSTLINSPRVLYIDLDIRFQFNKQNKLIEATKDKKIIGIVNAAALLGISDYEANYMVNAQGVLNMINFAKEIEISRFIQISSVVVKKKIKGPYAVTKLLGQNYLVNSSLNYTIFIPALVLGPESLGINRVLKNVFRFPLFVPLIGKGEQLQHPVFVKDFAWAIIQSIEEKKSSHKIYEIASENPISFKNLVKLILKIRNSKKIFVPIPIFITMIFGKIFEIIQKVPVFTSEHVMGVTQDSIMNITKIKKDLGFCPTLIEKSLQYTLNEIGNDWNQYLRSRSEKII